MSGTLITGLTRGGSSWTPQFVTAVDPESCIGCGRCYKVCSRNVFSLVDRADLVEDEDDEMDDVMMVMTVANADDCIGCEACSRVCPKGCHSYSSASA
ncbi:ferredoxin III, nif-specific [Pseudaeromonas sp. ZJS20]|uniref:ferredoxin III, nif-specific n=1 Tax=Pseudaeromonas aegiceratis TaxID=3153928 RepID=UPI00390C43B1